MLKYSYDKKDDIPEGLKDYYQESDGKYVLKVEGVVPKEKVDEFRNKNIELVKKLEKYKDIDPEKYKQTLEALKEEREKALLKDGKIEELIKLKTEPLTSQLTQTAEQAKKYREMLEKTYVEAEVSKAVSAMAVPRPGAMQDIMLRARQAITLGEDGQLKGDVNEFAKQLLKDAPYLFEQSSGGGASGGSGGGTPDNIINAEDKDSVITNLDKIAKGEMKVQFID
jgi:hypothetical protein